MRRLDGITHSADMTLSSCRSQRRPGQPGLLQPMGRKEPATWLLNTTSRAHRGAGWRSLFTWLSQSAPDTEQDPINKRD